MKRTAKRSMKKGNKLAIKFLAIVAGIVGGFFLLAVATLFIMGFFIDDIVPNDSSQIVASTKTEKKNVFESIVAPVMPIKEHTNFLIVGVDSDGEVGARTDTIMIGCFNATTKSLDLISVPRDTYVEVPQDRCDFIRENGPFKWAPAGGGMKINEVHHYAGEEYGIDFLTQQLEEMLDIDIEYYIRIDYEALHYVIDKIGGVEFDVPQRMIYDDPEQNLHINLQPGLQTLNGDQTEQLLRYRHGNYGTPDETPEYPRGDIGRVETQQRFLKAMISQILSKDKLVGNLPTLASAFFQYVKTNFAVSDVSRYLKYAKEVKPENIHTHTLPTEPASYGGRTYEGVVEAAADELIDGIFHYTELTSKSSADSKGKAIQILNGGYTKGLATQKKEWLEKKGYQVKDVGDYTGELQNTTRIVTRNRNEGQDLQSLFSQSKLEVDKNMQQGYDIIIILGIDEK